MTGWRLDGPALGRRVTWTAAVGGSVCAVLLVVWAAASGGTAAGTAGMVAGVGAVAGTVGCLAGRHGGLTLATPALVAGVLLVAVASAGGARLDVGPMAGLALAAGELWGWSLDHRADHVLRAAVARRARTLVLAVGAGLLASIALPVLATAGSGGVGLRVVAIAATVGVLALVARTRPQDGSETTFVPASLSCQPRRSGESIADR
jgi:hypothetical protein